VTRQQRFERIVGAFFTAGQGDDERAYYVAQGQLAHYVAQNAHLVTIKSGNGVQEAMRSRKRR
jgi:hypothetical protein